jgi:sugar-specific transcriptional regulator TrmB
MAITFQQTLKDIGFSATEAAIYIACVALGESPASVIAEKTAMNRSTTYVYLKAMEQRGWVGVTETKGIQQFYAKDPEILLRQTEQSVEQLKKALPDLRALSGRVSSTQPRVQYFPGIAGIKTILEDTLTAKETILTLGDADLIVQNLAEYYDGYIRRRVAAGVRTQAVLTAGPIGKKFLAASKEELRSVRLLEKRFAMPNEIKIYDRKVAIMSHKSPYGGVLIHDPAIYETQKTLFTITWEFAKSNATP